MKSLTRSLTSSLCNGMSFLNGIGGVLKTSSATSAVVRGNRGFKSRHPTSCYRVVASSTCCVRCITSSSSPLSSTSSSSSYSEFSLPFVDSRDVFVFDHSYDMNRFLQNSMKPMYYRHATSNHSAAVYLSELYRSSDYNFSSLGEFSLNVTAVHAYKTNINNAGTSGWFDKSASLRHTIYIWPEGLVIHNLEKADIPHICKLIGKSCKIDLGQLQKKISTSSSSKEVVIETFADKHVVVSSVSKLSSPKAALQVLKWVEITQLVKKGSASSSSSSSSSPYTGTRKPELELLVAAELREHRAKSSVIMLPSDVSFDSLDTYDRVLQAVNQAGV